MLCNHQDNIVDIGLDLLVEYILFVETLWFFFFLEYACTKT